MFVTEPSTRRSTRTRPAATSSTARWRSSIRPWSDTAKSTRSVFPSPSNTAWPSRRRRTRESTQSTTSSASTATAAAPSAIQAAVALETLTALRDREDDRVVGGVVVGVRLARHRRHLDLDHGRPAEARRREVREVDRLRLARADEADRLGLLDVRGARLRNRQLHVDVRFLRVTG